MNRDTYTIEQQLADAEDRWLAEPEDDEMEENNNDN